MKLNNTEIDRLDSIIASDTEEKNDARRDTFASLIATATIMYGRERVAFMLRETADMIEYDDGGDELHEAYVMRKEMFSDLRKL